MLTIGNLDVGHALVGDAAILYTDPVRGETATYREAVAFSHRFAHAVAAHGYGWADHLATIAPNGILMHEVYLGISRSDAKWVPLNARSSAREVADLVVRFDVRALFLDPELTDVAELLATAAPHVELVPLTRADVSAWMGDQPDAPFRTAVTDDMVKEIGSTGGTTGQPKGVPQTSIGVNFIPDRLTEIFPPRVTADSPRPVYLANAPLSHAAGRMFLYAVRHGAHVIVVPSATPAEIVHYFERFRVTLAWLPPTVVYGMLDVPGVENHDFSALQYVVYGASPMAPGKLARALQVFGPVFAQIYGQNETGWDLFMTPEQHLRDGDPGKGPATDFRLSAAGQVPAGVDLVLVDDHGQVVPRGEPGEIAVACAGNTPGYYRDPETTAQSRLRVGGTEYHLTGDIAFEDDEGFFHIVDRKKDMIITGGFNVYSAEVEKCILAFPGIAECAVFGIPDAKWGEAVTAAIELSPGAEVESAELTAFVREALGPVKTPKSIVVHASLPRNTNGKVLKRDLRQEYWGDRTRMVG
ncbi:MAG: long-chain fatty acid--CoA ligase [Naasia sp.]|nr:long-chain fatty acid--CoA ligase [Naasia sp.]